MPSKVRTKNIGLIVFWVVSCLCTSVFTMLPVEKGENINLVISGALLGVLLGGISVKKLRSSHRISRNMALIMNAQLFLIVISTVIVHSTSKSLANREGLPVINQISSWIIIIISSLFPFVYRGPSNEYYLARLLNICFAFGPMMTLLSISYELLFYVCFCSTVLIWLNLEISLYRQSMYSTRRTLRSSDIQAVLFFIFFINVAFFGTGNVASLSSFSLESVYRFTTVFNPFLMGALLITKILIPFFVVSSVLGILSSSIDLQPFTLFLTVMSISDIQTINFFYLVTDYGSWLEIGTSISHFCIAELFIIFTMILFLLSRWLVGHLISPKMNRLVNRMHPKIM
ncbi:GPI ethanolamine phosphate transferase 1 [Pilobolus umbonatus]|nr:GPI ethanolamine phosphate transferase 1 [Pilobolus umbonatus]